MTPPARSRGTLPPLAASWAIAAGIVALTVPLGLLDWIPFIGGLLKGSNAASPIAAVVLTMSLWVALFAAFRVRYIRRERGYVRSYRSKGITPPSTSLLGERLERIRHFGARASDRDSSDLASRSELDHARSDVSYVVARALVWAMPALGFLGTAAEMSQAIGGLSSSVNGATTYTQLQGVLVSQVIPPLAHAFSITLFALGASVVCHLLITSIHASEQRMLLEVEEFTLRRLSGKGAADPAVQQVEELMKTIKQATERAALGLRSAEIPLLLESIDQRLEQIRREIRQPRVLTSSAVNGFAGTDR